MKVKNRSASIVGYTIPDLNVRRRFAPGEVKDLSKEEVEKLLYQPGGKEMFEDNLQISEADMKTLGFSNAEPEYFYSEEDVKRIMTTGSLDEYLDMLDFAPVGILGLVKDYAIKLPLTDMNKIEGLKNKTGFDATAAIQNLRAVAEEQGEVAEAPTRQRRVQPTQKYKVID